VACDRLRIPSECSADDALQPLVSRTFVVFPFLPEEGLEFDILLVVKAVDVTFDVLTLGELFPTDCTPSFDLFQRWWKTFVVDGSQVRRYKLAGSGSFTFLHQDLVPPNH